MIWAAALGTVAGMTLATVLFAPTDLRMRKPSSAVWWLTARAAGSALVLWFMWFKVGWPVPGLVFAALIIAIPRLRSKKQAARDRAEGAAVAEWIISIQRQVEAGRQLNEAVRAASETPPAILAPVLEQLSKNMIHSSLQDSLRQMSEGLGHPVSDMAVAVLITAKRRGGGGQLADLLGQLSESLLAEVDMYEEMNARQSGMRLETTIVLAVNLLVAGGMPMMSPALLEGYRGFAGQIALAVFMGGFAGALLWVRALTRIPTGERFTMRWDAV